MYSIMYVYLYVYAYVCSYVCETNDSNDIRNEREELGLFCYYKVFTLPVKWCSVT